MTSTLAREMGPAAAWLLPRRVQPQALSSEGWEQMYCPLPKHEADKRGLSQPSIQKFGSEPYRTPHQKQGFEKASTVRHAPKPTERPLAAPAMALIDAVASSDLGHLQRNG